MLHQLPETAAKLQCFAIEHPFIPETVFTIDLEK